MNSFYGGKQGRSYKITARFDSIADMVTAFKQGNSYLDVNYDEYVIIDTVLRNNQRNNLENGIIYRRGYDFSQQRIEDVYSNFLTNGTLSYKDTTTTNLINEEDGTVAVYDAIVPKFYNYTWTATSPTDYTVTPTTFNQEKWEEAWTTFVTNPGGGAIYVGQIVGPEGATPAVEVISWEDFEAATSEGGDSYNETQRGEFYVNPNPGYVIDEESGIGVYRDTIQYGYCTLRDTQGNVTGAYLAFDIPYTVFEFHAVPIEPYNLPNDLISEDESSQGHPFYKNYNLQVPTGIHGQDITNLEIHSYSGEDLPEGELGGDYLTYTVTNYDATGEGFLQGPNRIAPYRVIRNITADVNAQAGGQISSLTVSYTQGEDQTFAFPTIGRLWIQDSDDENERDIAGNPYYKGHLYVYITTDNGARDLGLLKQVDSIARANDDLIYTNYNDGSSAELPIAEIAEIRLKGDNVLIRYRNLDITDSNFPTEEINGQTYINLGSTIKGNHILTNFSSLEALKAAYPNGFGEVEDAQGFTNDRSGWLATVAHPEYIDEETGDKVPEEYSIYAYDYLKVLGEGEDPADRWYKIQDLSAGAVKAEYSVLVAPPLANDIDNPDDEDAMQLNEKGIWFVITE